MFRHSKVMIYHATLPNPYDVDKLLRMQIEINGRRLISASYYENLDENLIIQMWWHMMGKKHLIHLIRKSPQMQS